MLSAENFTHSAKRWSYWFALDLPLKYTFFFTGSIILLNEDLDLYYKCPMT